MARLASYLKRNSLGNHRRRCTRAYMPERMTKDLDIIVHKNDGEAVVKKLEGAGYRSASQLAIPGYLMLSPEDVEAGVIFGSQPWLKEALAHPAQETWLDIL